MCDTYWSVDDCAWTRSPVSGVEEAAAGGSAAGGSRADQPGPVAVPDQRIDPAPEPAAP